MKKLTIAIGFLLSPYIFAQTEWPLQPWMQLQGTTLGQRLGASVSYLGKRNDSTLIGVSDGNGKIYIYQIKSPADTVPKYAYTGSSCALGDFNGDGIKDLVTGGNPTRIYLGKAQGVFDTIPFFVKYQESNGYYFGDHIAVGNINGDKYDDLLIADVGYPNDNSQGKVYLFLGGQQMDTIPHLTLNGEATYSYFGYNVACGDLNNDGYDDIIVKGYDNTKYLQNIHIDYVKIFLGGTSIDTVAWKYIRGNDSGLKGVASLDINGDGIKDLLWSTTDSLQSTVYIHYGKSNIDSIPNLKLTNPGVGGLGAAIADAGDMNGDGYDDIAVGAPAANQGLGMVFVYSGGSKMDGNYDAAAGLSVQSSFGASVCSIGDINGDGLADILVGAPDFQWSEKRGKWFILLGDSHIPVTGVKETVADPPKTFRLLHNYPNPFNPTTTISYTLVSPSKVLLSVYNNVGQKITDIVNKEQEVGEHRILFDAQKLASGLYFYKLSATNKQGQVQSETQRMTFLK